jgi:hypothetical protein
VVSIFVTATFNGGSNSLPPEIQVGWVVASVGDASIDSGGAAVVGVDAIGRPPHGDFTNQSGAQRTALTQWG